MIGYASFMTTKLASLLFLVVFAVGCGATTDAPADDESSDPDTAPVVENERDEKPNVTVHARPSGGVNVPPMDGSSKDGAY